MAPQMPYAPPPPAMAWGPGYPPPSPPQPLAGLAMATNILLGIGALVAAYSAYAFLHRASVLGDIQDGDFRAFLDADSADDPVKAAMVLSVLSGLAIAVLYMIWSHRARTNIEAWQGPRPQLSKGWAIGAWFIPLANLVMPSLVAKDTWKGSDPHVGGRPAGQGLLWSWWGTFVGSWVLFVVGTGTRDSADDVTDHEVTLDEYLSSAKTADSLSGVASLLRIAAAILAIVVVQRITTMQAQRMGQGPMGYAPGAPMMPAGPGMPMAPMPGMPGQPGMPGYPGAPMPPAAPPGPYGPPA